MLIFTSFYNSDHHRFTVHRPSPRPPHLGGKPHEDFDAHRPIAFGPPADCLRQIQPVKPSNNGTWQRVYQAPVQGSYWAMHFTDENHGWAVGGSGAVIDTHDGGATWQCQQICPHDLKDVFFLDSNIGWVVGDNNTIAKTLDGGQEWILTTPPPGGQTHFRSIYFVDANHGYLSSGDGGIWHTANGGESWATQQSGTLFPVSSFQFFNQNEGWAICSNWALRTGNGGTTWDRVTIPSEPDQNTPVYTSLFFLDESRGWASGLNASSNFNQGLPVFFTKDGGATWQAKATLPFGNNTTSIFFIDNLRGWIGTTNGIYCTADGGDTWTLQNHDYTFCNDFCFTDEDHGWALGMGGTIYRFERE